MKIHPKFIHHIFSHLYWIFPIFLLKQLKFICYQAHSEIELLTMITGQEADPAPITHCCKPLLAEWIEGA